MSVPEQFRLKNTIKYPTSLLIGGLSKLGLEIAESLMEQGGYVIIVDTVTQENVEKLNLFPKDALISLLDYTSIPHLEEDIRRLDYVFYFNHESYEFHNKISTQEFLTFSNYIDAILSLSSTFEAKFLLTSSIKANQVLLSENDIGMNYGIGSSVTHIYREMEIQKYAEGLVMEYGEKVNLDVRIVRLGEIIGDGMNFEQLTPYMKMVLQAVRNHLIELQKDGLENEWFIHLLDAAYAIIKAQFSQGTAQKIFSASYDTSFSHLSIAYKLQEMSDKPVEIRFTKEVDNLPPLKLYKPAKNLSDIGWMPRISFNKSIQESLAAAKIFLAEKNLKRLKNGGPNTLGEKLKGFLNLAQDTEFGAEKDILEDVASEHIANQKTKKNRLQVASEDLRAKRRKRPKSNKEKFQDYFWRLFSGLASVFSIFRNKSPLELGMLLFLLIFSVVFYFTIAAPGIFIGRNYANAYFLKEELGLALEDHAYVTVEDYSMQIRQSIENSYDTLENYEFVASFFTLDEEFSEYLKIQDAYVLYFEGLNNVSSALGPFHKYLTAYDNNLATRTGTDSYLSVSTSGFDYGAELSATEDNSDYVDLGLEKIHKASSLLNEYDYRSIPSQISKKLLEINTVIADYTQNIAVAEYEKFIPELLGSTGAKTHVIGILDNTRLTPMGGDLAAFALVTFQKGTITEVIVRPIRSGDFPQINEQVVELEDMINTRRFAYVQSEDLEIQHTASLGDKKEFSRVIREIFEEEFSRDVDGVIFFDLETLMSLLEVQETGSVSIGGVDFTAKNFLSSLNTMQPANADVVTRRDYIAQTLAHIFFSTSENISEVYPSLVSTLGSMYSSQHIFADFDDSSLQDLIDEQYSDFTEDTDTFLEVNILMDDPAVVNIQRFTDVNIALETRIKADMGLDQTVTVTFSDVGARQDVSICIPLSVQSQTIQLIGIESPSLRTAINKSSSEQCVVVRSSDKNEVSIKWSEPSLISNVDTAQLVMGVGKVNGATTTFDHTVVLDSELRLVQISPAVSFSENSVGYNIPLFRDQTIVLDIERR